MEHVTQHGSQSVLRLLVSIIISVSFSALAFQSSTASTAPTQTPPSLYSDCSVLALPDIDKQPLTKAEILAQKYQILIDALDQNSQCMAQAAKAGQQAQVASGGGVSTGAGASIDGQNTMQGARTSASNPSSSTPSPVNTQSTPTSQGDGAANQVVTGKSAGPCALYQELLSQATSPEEREFYESELKKYGCQ
jgi:hypothetical protein